jgi:hypothetical protein
MRTLQTNNKIILLKLKIHQLEISILFNNTLKIPPKGIELEEKNHMQE